MDEQSSQPNPFVFICYAAEDAEWFEKGSLIPTLGAALKIEEEAEIWFDQARIKGGDHWESEIEKAIEKACIALLLVSRPFLNSEFIRTKELKWIEERSQRGDLVVIPILLDYCDWQSVEFLHTPQMLPYRPPTPLMELRESKAEWSKAQETIIKEIRSQIRRLRERSRTEQNEPVSSDRITEPTVQIDEPQKDEAIAPEEQTEPASDQEESPTGPAALPSGEQKEEPTSEASLVSESEPEATKVETDTPTITPMTTAPDHSIEVISIGFCPNEGSLATVSGNELRVWEISTQVVTRKYRHGGAIECCAWSGDGRFAAFGDRQGDVRIFGLETGELTESFPKQAPTGSRERMMGVAFSPDQHLLVSGSEGGEVDICEVSTQKLIHSFIAPKLKTLAVSPDGGTLATAHFNEVQLWNTRTWDRIDSLEGQRGNIHAVAFSPDGALLATGCVDNTLVVWNLPEGSFRYRIDDFKSWVKAIEFFPNGEVMAVGSGNGAATDFLRFFDAETGKLIGRSKMAYGSTRAFSFNQDGKRMASGGSRLTSQGYMSNKLHSDGWAGIWNVSNFPSGG